ncbi:TIGD2.2 family protein [Megaselia abdita]
MEKKRQYSTSKLLKKEVKLNSPLIRKSNCCCVSSCSNSCKQLYLFPSDPERNEEWNEIINKNGGEDVTHMKNKLICRIHFEEKYLTKNNSLTKDAIPTLNLVEEAEDDQSDLSDYYDVIESFNSSYPCFDDDSSYMMEANVEIRETGESLRIENDDQEILISSQEEEDSSNGEFQTNFTLNEKINILNEFNNIQDTKKVASKFNTHFKIVSEIIDNSTQITKDYHDLPINMQTIKVNYDYDSGEPLNKKLCIQMKMDLKLEDKVLIVEAFKESRSMKQISKKSGLPYSQIKEVLQDGESIIMQYNRLPSHQRKTPTINLVLTKLDPSKEKHFQSLTLAEKIEILKEYNKFENIKSVCSKYHISESTMQNIIKLKDELQYLHYKMPNEFHYRTRMPTSEFKIAIDTTVLEWIKRCVKRGITVKDELIKHTGNELRYIVPYSEFRSSNRWIERFKKKYHVTNMITEKPVKVASKLTVYGSSLVLKDIIFDLYKYTSDCVTDRVFKSICEHNKWSEGREYENKQNNQEQFLLSNTNKMYEEIDEDDSFDNDDIIFETYEEAITYLKPLKTFANAKQSTAGISILKQIESILQSSVICD